MGWEIRVVGKVWLVMVFCWGDGGEWEWCKCGEVGGDGNGVMVGWWVVMVMV